MSVTRKTNLANRSNYGNKRSTSTIKYIVFHYTANDGDTDEANGNYFKTGGRNASAHYFVDDDSITQSVPDDYEAWSVGGNKYANTKGGTLYGKATNANTLNIELCDTVKDGKYQASAKTQENAIILAREKMKQYNIPIDRVIRHYDVTGKLCPAYFVDETKWNEFKKRIVNEMQVKQNPGNTAYSEKRIWYRGHASKLGWLDPVRDGQVCGTVGGGLPLEALKIDVTQLRNYLSKDITVDVKAHIQNVGWVEYKNITSDTVIGTTGKGQRIEALQITVNNLPAGKYFFIRPHISGYGWTGWVGNGFACGTVGIGKGIEALQMKIV